MSGRPAARLAATGALALGALACLSPATAGNGAAEPALAWPPGDPRVRLEAVLRLDELTAGAGSRLAKWLGGREPQPIVERPYGVAWVGDDLVVSDPSAGVVVRLPRHGPVRRSRPGTLQSPIGVAACRGGVVVSDSRAGKVWLLGPELEPRRVLLDGLARPTGIVCLGERIFVVETGGHRVLRIEPGGEVAVLGGRGERPGEFNFPSAIAADGDSLWVGDTLNFRVQRLDPATGAARGGFGQLGDAPGEMPRVKGLAVDSRGRLWVADAYLDRVAIYAATGEFLLDLGRRGSGPGEFSFPAGIASHPDGRVAVVDSLNRRVQVFASLPGAEEKR